MKYGDCYVYAAMYDENGVMIGIDRVPLSMKDDTKISLDKKDNAKNVNINLKGLRYARLCISS